MPSSNGPLVIAIKAKGKYRFHAASMLLAYNLQKGTMNKVAYFLMICYHAPF
jgi:hypothetical protein